MTSRVTCPGEPPAAQARGCLLTAEGPVAGSPSVMLGKDGDVYRGRGAIEPSRVTSLCAKLVWRQNTRWLSHGLLRTSAGIAHQEQ